MQTLQLIQVSIVDRKAITKLCIFDIKIIMGLRQTFMTLMRWAIDVPHKQLQYEAILQGGANHLKVVLYEL